MRTPGPQRSRRVHTRGYDAVGARTRGAATHSARAHERLQRTRRCARGLPNRTPRCTASAESQLGTARILLAERDWRVWSTVTNCALEVTEKKTLGASIPPRYLTGQTRIGRGSPSWRCSVARARRRATATWGVTWPSAGARLTIHATGRKSRARRHYPPSPGSPRVDAFDEGVVARVPCGGRVPDGRAREWTIFGKFSVLPTLVGNRSTSADAAIAGTSTAPMGATTVSAPLVATR